VGRLGGDGVIGIGQSEADHQPSRWYRECSCLHPDDLPESVPEDVAADYEADFYDTHFTCDDDFESCEAAFDGIGCGLCTEQQERFVAWPCEFGDPATPLPEALADMPPTLPEVTA
jgi:hypothetical protein